MERTLYIYGNIARGERSSAAYVERELQLAEAMAQPVRVKINSPGGSVEEAVMMHNLLKEYPYKVTASVNGTCASAATLLLFAADEREATPYSKFMIHLPMSTVSGNSGELRRRAELHDATTAQLIAIYAQKSTVPAAKLAKMLEAETWMTPEQAVNYGFIDKTTDTTLVQAHADMIADATIYNSLGSAEHFVKNFNKQTTEPMERNTELEALKAELEAQKAQNTELKANLAKEHAQRVHNAVEAAIADGRIAEDAKEDWTKTLEANFESGSRVLASIAKAKTKETPQAVELTNPEPVLGMAKVRETTRVKQSRANWSIRDWEKQDPSGLLQIKRETPELYNKMFDEFYTN